MTMKLPEPDPQHIIAVRAGEALSAQQWWASVSAHLQQIERSDAQHWLLFSEDSFRFSCGLFALLLAGRTPVLPPNTQPDTLAALLTQVDAICADAPQGLSAGIRVDVDLCAPPLAVDPALNARAIDGQRELWLFTSGSTGQPKKVVKSWRQLAVEVATLEQTFAQQLLGGLCVSTVSHQHIYGLLFTVLWPLLSGRCRKVEMIRYPEQLQQAMQDHDVVLISSPSFLSHLLADEASASGRPLWSVSSGGALSYAVAAGLARIWGRAPTEVFGSSETGGVAYRSQQHPDTPWRAFAPVAWRVAQPQGALEICSPNLPDTEGWYRMDDSVIAVDDGFVLQGRLDRIVKIAEKRVSLDQMSALLSAHPYIDSCELITLQRKRTEIAAVVKLNQAGSSVLAAGKLGLNQALCAHLRGSFEAVTLPRRWRYVEQIPTNSQGKRQLHQLRELFS